MYNVFLLRMYSFQSKTIVSEVGFEPTPTYVDQNAPSISKEESELLGLAP